MRYNTAKNFHQEKLSIILLLALIGENIISKFFVLCYDYREDIATFTALVKNFSTEYFYNTKVARLGKIFVQ